jgi:hypothetical protein
MAHRGVVTKVDTDPAARDERMLTRLGLDPSSAVLYVSNLINGYDRVITHNKVEEDSF